MTDTAPRLAARSAGAVADVELLRVARTSAADLDRLPPPRTLGGRIRRLLGR